MNVVHGTILSSVNYDIKFSINMHGTSTKGKIVEVYHECSEQNYECSRKINMYAWHQHKGNFFVEVYHSAMNVVNKTMNAAERSTCIIKGKGKYLKYGSSPCHQDI
jgi:hypothetical protein